MSQVILQALDTLAAIPGVRAAVAATQSDGLPAATVAAIGVDGDASAGTARSQRPPARRANRAAGYGETRHLALDAENGRLFVAAAGDLVLVILAERDAGAGLLRVALQRALGDMA